MARLLKARARKKVFLGEREKSFLCVKLEAFYFSISSLLSLCCLSDCDKN